MKKLYALAILLAFAFGAQAQRQYSLKTTLKYVPAPSQSLPSVQALVIDTLFPAGTMTGRLFCDTGVAVFCSGALNGAGECSNGYLGGNNQYGDLEKVSKWGNPFAGVVQSVDMFILKASAADPAEPITAVVYGSDNAAGLPVIADRTLSTPIPMSGINTGWNTFVFPNAAIFSDTFFVGLVLPVTDGDTLALLTTPDPDPAGGGPGGPPCAAAGATRTYERFEDGTFHSFFDPLSWNASLEFLMQVVIQYDDATATKNLLTNLVKVAPVPASQSVAVTLPANIKGSTTWQIISSDGKVVSKSGSPVAGATLRIARSNLKEGVYTLRLNTAGGPVNKRIVFAD